MLYTERGKRRDDTPETWDEGLVKIWSHRSTMHVVQESEVGLYVSAFDRMREYEDGWWGMTAQEMREWEPFLLREIDAGKEENRKRKSHGHTL